MEFKDVRPGKYIDKDRDTITVKSTLFEGDSIVIKATGGTWGDDMSTYRSDSSNDVALVDEWKEYEPTYTLTKKQLDQCCRYTHADGFLTNNNIKENK